MARVSGKVDEHGALKQLGAATVEISEGHRRQLTTSEKQDVTTIPKTSRLLARKSAKVVYPRLHGPEAQRMINEAEAMLAASERPETRPSKWILERERAQADLEYRERRILGAERRKA